MKRRTFLKSAAASFPIALTQPFLLAESSDTPLKEAHVVPSGQDIEGAARGLGFSHIAFKNLPPETGGNLFLIEHSNLLPGGPPLHLHYEQEEWFYILEGEVLFQVGDKRVQLKPGDSVLGPRKVPHGFTAVGTTPAKMLIAFSPAGKMEQFFRDNANGKTPMWDAALMSKYGVQWIGPPINPT